MSQDTTTRPATTGAFLGLDAVDWCVLIIGTAMAGLLLLVLA
jgi:hypothetical protein